ncbi:MAG: amidohydrolase family protein [Planctomycetes bacterium]|nr:amidohydrolase family protein [Planctomycetota bacterium]
MSLTIRALVAGWLVVSLADARAIAADRTQPIVFQNTRILTASGGDFDPGTLVVRDGKIEAVGPADDVDVPEGAAVHDLAGKVLIPGLIDSHSHLGVYSRPGVVANSDGNEMTGPVQAIVRALDSLNPFDPGIRMANAGGVTTANIMPGSGNVIGGQTIYVKLRGYTPEQMWIASEDVLGGLKMANGENPKRAYGSKDKAPGTRMKVAALQRAEFIKAQDYLRKWDAYRKKLAAGEDAAPPDVDLGLETLGEVLAGKRTVHFHTHRADDILTVLRLRKEFGFELLLQHGTEAYKVLDEIAAAGVPVSMTIVDSPGGKAEVVDFTERCGAELASRGIPVLVNTDDPITESRFFLRTAATTVRGGLGEQQALQAITVNAARVMHLDDRLGTLEAGKDADFAVLSGPPFSVYTRVLETWIDGKRVFDLDDPKQRLYQTGGFAVAEASRIPEAQPLVKPQPQASEPAAPADAPAYSSEAKTLVVLAGRVHPVSGKPIDNGAVLIEDGRIKWIGPQAKLERPKNAAVLTAAVVTPGLIDAHSVVPLAGEYNIPADQDQDETSDPNQADVRALDGFHPGEPLLRFLLSRGVTVIHACPGRANVIAGTTGVFRTHGRTAEEMAIRCPQAMLFNLGESPKETYKDDRPETRMGTAALIRAALAEAGNFSRKLEAAAKKEDADRPDRNLKHEALAKVLSRDLPAMFCAQRADDLLTALRLVREFKLDATLALAAEGYLVADEIAKARVPVIVHPTMQRNGRMETFNTYLGNAAALRDKDIRIAIGSGVEGYVPKTRVVRYEAALAMVYGLGFDMALKAVTLDAARVLKIDEDFGSLEPGKAADLVLYDGDPFEHVTHVTRVIVDGRVAYDRADEQPIPLADRLYYSSPEIPCCLGW